jgi:hypothetical protein
MLKLSTLRIFQLLKEKGVSMFKIEKSFFTGVLIGLLMGIIVLASYHVLKKLDNTIITFLITITLHILNIQFVTSGFNNMTIYKAKIDTMKFNYELFFYFLVFFFSTIFSIFAYYLSSPTSYMVAFTIPYILIGWLYQPAMKEVDEKQKRV